MRLGHADERRDFGELRGRQSHDLRTLRFCVILKKRPSPTFDQNLVRDFTAGTLSMISTQPVGLVDIMLELKFWVCRFNPRCRTKFLHIMHELALFFITRS
jgi:hypothetical protein